jgi:proteasome lid subunit RPN8/RPN11
VSRKATHERPAIPGLRHICEAIVYQHVFANAEREVGGVLVGRVPKAGQMPIVTGAIPAIAADEQRAALTFTQDSWEHVHRVLEAEYQGDQIIGWYHSHPAFGIFLSEHDLFIHRNFFSGPSQIALVVDPISQEEGVFAWRPSTNDVDLYLKDPTPAGWYALGVDGKALPTRRPRQPVEHDQAGTPSAGSAPYPLLIIALAAVAGFSVALAMTYTVTRGSNTSKKTPTVTTVQAPASRTPTNAPSTTPGATTPVTTPGSTISRGGK